MKTLITIIALGFLSGCAGLQLEGIKYTLPDGQVTSCVTHPDMAGYMRCSYMDGDTEIVIAVKQDLLSSS